MPPLIGWKACPIERLKGSQPARLRRRADKGPSLGAQKRGAVLPLPGEEKYGRNCRKHRDRLSSLSRGASRICRCCGPERAVHEPALRDLIPRCTSVGAVREPPVLSGSPMTGRKWLRRCPTQPTDP